MTTATEYRLKATVTGHLTWLALDHPAREQARQAEGVTRQEVLDELHDRALFDYHASTQGLDELVVALGHAHTGRLTSFTGAKLIRALGVLADQADRQDWAGLAVFGYTRDMVLDALFELATR